MITPIQTYLKQLKKCLPIWSKHRKAILSAIETDLSTYCQDYPNATYEDMIDVFGTPKDISLNYLKESSNIPSSKLEQYRSILLGGIGTIVIMFLCFSIFLIVKQRSCNYNISYTNTISAAMIEIGEVYGIDLNELIGGTFILSSENSDYALTYPNDSNENFILTTPNTTYEITGGSIIIGLDDLGNLTANKKASIYDENDNLMFSLTLTATFRENTDKTFICTDVSYSYEVLDEKWKITEESCSNSGTVASSTITATTYFLFLPIDSETIELELYVKEDGCLDFMN